MTDGLPESDEPGDAGASEVVEPDWEDPPRPTGTAATPVLVVDGIEAPLDWLVDQVRAGRFDLASLSILALMEAFGTALEAAMAGAGHKPAELSRWGAWLVLAADLALLRSQLLVPATPQVAQEARDAAETLRRQVAHRAAAASLADWLERREQLGRDVWARGRPEVRAAGKRSGDVTALFRACLPALRVPDDVEHSIRLAAAPAWSVTDALARIRAMVADSREGGLPLQRFLPDIPAGAPDYEKRCRAAVASTFGAALELTRDGVVCLAMGAADSLCISRCDPLDPRRALSFEPKRL